MWRDSMFGQAILKEVLLDLSTTQWSLIRNAVAWPWMDCIHIIIIITKLVEHNMEETIVSHGHRKKAKMSVDMLKVVVYFLHLSHVSCTFIPL